MNEKTKDTETPVLKPVAIRTAGVDSFCRGGERFMRVAKIMSDYTSEQLDTWQNEPMLIVEFVD